MKSITICRAVIELLLEFQVLRTVGFCYYYSMASVRQITMTITWEERESYRMSMSMTEEIDALQQGAFIVAAIPGLLYWYCGYTQFSSDIHIASFAEDLLYRNTIFALKICT